MLGKYRFSYIPRLLVLPRCDEGMPADVRGNSAFHLSCTGHVSRMLSPDNPQIAYSELSLLDVKYFVLNLRR